MTASIPADDPRRALALARPETDPDLVHIGIVGDTYTILLGGQDTNGRFTVIDMHVRPGGGPGRHRHDFEETFSVLEGEVEVDFRDKVLTARAGETLNIPANAPHRFRNVSNRSARLLCVCAPAGQEEFFIEVGTRVPTRTTPPPEMTERDMADFAAKAQSLAAKYRTELLPPQGEE